MAKEGRKGKITPEEYLEAVRRTRTLSDIKIGGHLGLNRTTIYRFRKDVKNADTVKESINIIKNITRVSFDDKNISMDAFKRLPIIEEWDELMISREVSTDVKNKRIRILFNVCKQLKTHPEVISLDQVAKLCSEMRKLKIAEIKAPSGLAFLSIRKPIRSFFQLIRGVSGELLTTRGIDAGRTKGAGSQAREKINPEQRKEFVKAINSVIMELDNMNVGVDKVEYLGIQRHSMTFPKDIDIDLIIDELLNISYFMYYTGTRITATLKIKLDDPKHKFTSDKYEIHVLDKGRKGGQHWQKILLEDGLEKMKKYLSRRFKIKIDDLEKKLPLMNDTYLFPFWYLKIDYIRPIYREALKRVGVLTNIPCHLFRHTYAQDGLHATDFNYELVASIGGWTDTATMKRHYGEMDDEAKERGLRKMMGLPIEDVTYELRWDGAVKKDNPFRCPQCNNQFSTLIGVCPRCSYSNYNAVEWINPDFKMNGDKQ